MTCCKNYCNIPVRLLTLLHHLLIESSWLVCLVFMIHLHVHLVTRRGDCYPYFALEVLDLQSLDDRRESLCLKFAKKCLQVKKFQSMFPKRRQVHSMKKRKNEKFVMRRSLTGRHQNSAIPYMQRLLNRVEAEKSQICKQIDNFLPVNSRLYKSLSLR